MIKKLLLILIVFLLSVSTKAQTDSSSVYSESQSSDTQVKNAFKSSKKVKTSKRPNSSKNPINKPRYDKFGNSLSSKENTKQAPKQSSTPKSYLDYRRYQGRTRYIPKPGSIPQKPTVSDIRNSYAKPNPSSPKPTPKRYAAPVRLAKRAPKRIIIIDSLPKEETAITGNKNLNTLDSAYLKSALGLIDTLPKKDSSFKRALIITPEEMVYHSDSINYYKTSRAYGIRNYGLPAEEMKCLLTTDPNATREYKYFQKNAKPGLILVSLGMLAGVVELVKFHDMKNPVLNPYFIAFSLGEIIGARLLYKSDRHLSKSVSTFNKYVK